MKRYSPASRPRDNFDALRLVAAMMVLVGHGYVLTGSTAPRIFEVPLHTLGVGVFFAISGYLVTGSWERSQDVMRFLWHRCLRIFPALVVVVYVTVLFIGPLLTTTTLPVYFASAETYEYLTGLALLPQYELPGVFESETHARNAVNGSLWTLGIEFLCYFAVLMIGLTMRRSRMLGFIVLGGGALAIIVLAHRAEMLHALVPAAEMIVFFAVGSILRLGVPRRWSRFPLAVALLALWSLASVLWPDAALAWAWIAVPYCAVTFGLASTPGVRSVGRVGDLSYGTYLWAYPVQQTVIDIYGSIPLALNFALVAVVTLALAFISWHVVEKRTLEMKNSAPFVLYRKRVFPRELSAAPNAAAPLLRPID